MWLCPATLSSGRLGSAGSRVKLASWAAVQLVACGLWLYIRVTLV